MQTYIILMRLTDEGVRQVRDLPEHIDGVVPLLESLGGRLVTFHAVLGDYDYVAVAEAFNEEVLLEFVLALGEKGYVRTVTWPAFPKEDVIRLSRRRV
jgi:uncharacterized protein with GYD domain